MLVPVLRPVGHAVARLLPTGASGAVPSSDYQQPPTMGNHPMMVCGPCVMAIPYAQYAQSAPSWPFVVGGPIVSAQPWAAELPWEEELPQVTLPTSWINPDDDGSRRWADIDVEPIEELCDTAHTVTAHSAPTSPARSQKGNGRRQRRKQFNTAAIGTSATATFAEEGHKNRLDVASALRLSKTPELELAAPKQPLPVAALIAQSLAATKETTLGSGGEISRAEADAAIERLVAVSAEPILEGEEASVERRELVDWITSKAWPMAAMRHGTRIVQKAFDVLESTDKVLLAEGLKGHVQEALESPHANHVLQKCVETMPPAQIRFVLEEMVGYGAFFARRRFGCRVIERLLEHCPGPYVASLIDEILADAEKLCRHPFGNFVVQHVLEHGTVEQQKQVADILRANILHLARHRIASHVVEAAFVHCACEDKQALVEAMGTDTTDLSRTRYGSFVVREMHCRLGE